MDWELGITSDNGQHCQIPRILPQIVHGSRLAVFHCFDGKAEEGVEVILTTGDTKQKVVEETETSLTREMLHKVFAMKMMRELERDKRNGEKEKKQIKNLSIKYGILSRFTSLVGVEEGTGRNMGDIVVRRVDNMWHTRSSNVPRFMFTRNHFGWRPDLCLTTTG